MVSDFSTRLTTRLEWVRKVIEYAADRDLNIGPEDIDYTPEFGCLIDGMDAFDWVDAMTAE